MWNWKYFKQFKDFFKSCFNVIKEYININLLKMVKSIKISLGFTAITIIGSLLPLISSSIVIWVYGGDFPTLSELTGFGEITIICIPIIIGALFSLYNNKVNRPGFNYIDLIFWGSLLFLFFALIIYSYGLKELKINNSPRERLITFSYFFLSWAILTTFVAKFLESRQVTVGQERLNDQYDLERRFRES